jgi:multisubunit Na+/H+ antiporter MnhB subunit
MSGAGGEIVGKALMGVAQVKVGRILLWIVAGLLVLVSFTMPERPDGGLSIPMGLAIILAVLAIAGGLKARRDNGSSPIRWLVPRVALALAGMGVAALLFWLRTRGRKPEPLPPPPRPEEIDQLVRLEQEEERAA